MATIADADTDLPDILLFYEPEEILGNTEHLESLGVGRVVCFAARLSGESFCFQVDECNQAGGGDAPVWLFSREIGDLILIEDSFVGFLGLYLSADAGL
jgi:hypothetical protein